VIHLSQPPPPPIGSHSRPTERMKAHPNQRPAFWLLLMTTCLALAALSPTASATENPLPSGYEADAAALTLSYAFEEPLLPIGEFSLTHEAETAALRTVLDEYLDQDDTESLDPFVEFTQQYPDSAWNIAVLTDVGFTYRQTGHYSRALEAFERAWALAWEVALYDAEGSPDEAAATYAGRALAELAELYARLGRVDELSSLLSEVNPDILTGPATEKIARAAEGLWMMENHPERAFRCGPFAIGNILKQLRPEDREAQEAVDQFGSTPDGLPLTDVAALADGIQLDLQMAYREPGADVKIPSVVHWRSNHYAALLDTRHLGPDTLYWVVDPTFGRGRWLSAQAIEDESSGYFLIPEGTLDEGWRAVTSTEGANVWGSGFTDSNDSEQLKEDSDLLHLPGSAWQLREYDLHG